MNDFTISKVIDSHDSYVTLWPTAIPKRDIFVQTKALKLKFLILSFVWVQKKQ